MKNKNKYQFYVIAVCFLLAVNCYGQSIEELFEKAIEQNLELKILKNENLVMLEKVDQVSQLPQPEINLGIVRPNTFMHSGERILALRGIQKLPWFGLLNQQKQLVLTEASAHFQEIDNRKLELRYELEMAYMKFYEKRKSVSILQKYLTILKSMEAVALTNVESGKGNMVAVLRIQLQQKEVEQQIEILKNEAQQPLILINQILNRSLDISVELKEELSFANISMNKTEQLENIVSTFPKIKNYTVLQELSNEKIKLNELQNKPTFGVGFDYNLINRFPNANFENNGRDFLQLNIGAMIPIYKKKFRAKEREENLKIISLDWMKKDVINKIQKEIEIGFSKYETAKLQYELYVQQIDLTKSAIEILQSNYSVNENRFNEILLLEKELIDYELKMLVAIVQSHLAKSSIERFIIK